MRGVWRNPFLAVGIGLLVLGAGNWAVSRNRISEHAQRVAPVPDGYVASLDDFHELTPRTNRTLLKRLNRGYVNYTMAEAKLDFYRIVESGGRLLALLGMLSMTFALVQSRRRLQPGEPADDPPITA